MTISIRPATPNDVPTVAFLIRALSQYEKLEHEVTMTEDRLRATMFGPRPYAEALLAEDDGKPVGFALFFHNYSTFLAQPGLYLEDLYVPESHRGKGIGKSLLVQLAKIAVEPPGVGGARLERRRDRLLREARRQAELRVDRVPAHR